jgi:dsDNA-specific endonuclease/ATPase MutS2
LVTDYLEDAYQAGFLEVRFIHGKGIGVQREIVRTIALRNPHVASVQQGRKTQEVGCNPDYVSTK